jgi:hypothetical protein
MATTGGGFIEEEEVWDVANRPLPKWPATQQDWDEQRDRIRTLYQERRKPLKNVMTIMEREYLFKAT